MQKFESRVFKLTAKRSTANCNLHVRSLRTLHFKETPVSIKAELYQLHLTKIRGYHFQYY
jgi:hypothetical protein